MEQLADPRNFGDLDERDPQSMTRFMKKMSREMGEDLEDGFDKTLESAQREETQSPMSEDS